MAIDSISSRSRRAVLFGALGGVVASVAAAIDRSSPASASDGDTVKVGHTYSAQVRTAIKAESTTTAIYGSSPSGFGIHGHSAYDVGVYGSNELLGTGVKGTSTSGAGVYGQSSSSAGVHGDSADYSGVLGTSTNGFGVDGRSTSSPGVRGYTSATDQPAVLGQSASDGTGVKGFSGATDPGSAPAKTGVFGSANQDASAIGIYGSSSTGRGAVFTGKVSQLRLQPSGSGTHPTSGAAGDLFLDSSKRLWLCKGGTTWALIA